MKKILAIVLTLVLIFQTYVIAFAEDGTTDASSGSSSGTTVPVDGAKKAPDYNFKFETVAKNSGAELLIDKSVNALRLVSKSGKYFDTKIMNGQIGNEFVKNIQKSDFALTYYTDKINANTTTLDNYTMSIAMNQVTYTPIENGIRCTFVVGDPNKLNTTMFPMYISKERMQNLVLKYLNDKEKAELVGKDSYYSEAADRYIRNWATTNSDGSIRQVAIPKLKKMYSFFYEKGKYTADELAADNQQYGEKVESKNITTTVVVDYLLDGNDLVVRVPVDKIEQDSKFPVSDLLLTPYLLAGDTFDNGYLFVPDGTGGIINFNSGKVGTDVLSIPVYGTDLLKDNRFYTDSFIQSTLPVVGIKKNDMAILGIIEEGAEIATITANVSGKMDEFNKVNIDFNLQYMEKMPLAGNRGYVMPQYTKNGYKGNITMRYKLLEGDNASYTGMAKAYKSYLEQKGEIKKNAVPENSPLFVEMIATAPKEKSFMGIHYMSYKSMTSFSQAQNILESLKGNGINNIVLQYTDWANGGAKNTSLNSINVINSIGGKKGLSKLISYTKSQGISFFPEIKPMTTYSTWGIKSQIAHLLNDMKASLPSFNMVTKQATPIREWMISPTYLGKYFNKILAGTGKLGIENLAVGNAGTLLYGDYYNKKQLLRSDALPVVKSALGTLSKDRNLLFSNANSYAYAYASYIADLPISDSGRRAIDYSVPFVQMVLENDVPYSMEAFNNDSQQGIEKYILKAIETKSNLKWIFTSEDEKEFAGAYLSKTFSYRPYFEVRYSRWQDKIGQYYNEYNTFYQKVKDAEIKNHEVISTDLVKVEYTNGVKVYINYDNKAHAVDGQWVSPLSHIIIG